MTDQRQTVVIAGSGNVAQYLVEEFLSDGSYDIALITRTDRELFHKPGVTVYILQAYTKETVLPVLDGSNTTVLISTLDSGDAPTYTSMHEALLNACRESRTCKRFIPSEYLGNLRDDGLFPRSSYSAHKQFRDMLKSETEVKWILVNQGWLADYFVQPADGSRSYIRPFPQGWPIDLDRKTVRLIGTGNEPVTWTAARDMAKAVVKLISHEEWPDHVYLSGETGTWNDAVTKLEKFLGCKLKRISRTKEEIDADLRQADEAKRYTASIDEWSLLGAAAVPPEEAARQRERYFKDVHLRNIEELLESSKQMQII